MSILKKVKLSLLASVIILSSQRASALGSDPDDLEGNKIPISQPSSSRDCSKSAADLEEREEPCIPQDKLGKFYDSLRTFGSQIKGFEEPKSDDKNQTVIKHKKIKGKSQNILDIKSAKDFIENVNFNKK